MILFVCMFGCGGDEAAYAADEKKVSVIVRKEKRAEIKEHRQQLKVARKETKCIKAYIKDMQAQQQGIQPDWEQPEFDIYMSQEKCEPYLVNLKR
jgi:hypothetical protein